MVLILPEDRYDAWLQAGVNGSGKFLLQFPADDLVSTA